MTRDNIEAQCLRISANYESSGFCRFVRGGGVLCFIDTSQSRNGTRGIAFKRDGMVMCLGKGERHEIAYSSIKDIQIISSFEDFFADELMIVCDDGEVRIGDYSLDKSELKRFIEELSVESKKALEHRAQAEEYAKIIAERLAQSTLREERSRYSEPSVLPIKEVTSETDENLSVREEPTAAEEQMFHNDNNFDEDTTIVENDEERSRYSEPSVSSIKEVISETDENLSVYEEQPAAEEQNAAEPRMLHNDNNFNENTAIVENDEERSWYSEPSVSRIKEVTSETDENLSVREEQPAAEPPIFNDDRSVSEEHSAYEERMFHNDNNYGENTAIVENNYVPDLENESGSEISAKEIPDRSDDFYFEGGEPFIQETVIDIPEERALNVPENYDPAPIPEEKINWISGSFYTKRKVVPEETPVISVPEAIEEEKAVIDEHKEPDNDGAEDPQEVVILYSRDDENAPSPKTELFRAEETHDPPSDGDEMARIGNMTREETLAFLAESLNEINAESERSEPPAEETTSEIDKAIKTISDMSEPPESAIDDGKLTIEPIWGDIYIKASRNLRELIEDGRLTMDQIKTELKDKLLSSARAFVEVTADEAKVPKVLVPKITELRSASRNFEEYFRSGEDVGVRAMFFMMYQMLSYADRIAETPETKERLNDFFRRFGPAGITFSMLDMRV